MALIGVLWPLEPRAPQCSPGHFSKKFSVVWKIAPNDLGKRKNDVPMGNLCHYRGTKNPPRTLPFDRLRALRRAFDGMMDKNFLHDRKRGPKTHDRSHHSGLGQNPGEDPRTLRKHALHGALRVLAIRAGTIEKTVDDLLDMRPPEPEFRGESFVADTDEFLETTLDTAISKFSSDQCVTTSFEES